jgi:hypothetical protein
MRIVAARGRAHAGLCGALCFRFRVGFITSSRATNAAAIQHFGPMFLPESSKSDDVEHLLRNAQLRDELEPLLDESIDRVNPTAMSTRSENEFLESMLEWERAPMLPISQWFEPPLVLPHPDRLSQNQLSLVLRATIEKFFEMHIVLDFTDHLSDYQLYGMLFRDILPSHEKRLERRTTYLHWDCANIEENPHIWLRYYASRSEREMWAEENDQPLPPHEEPPFRRDLPRAPL